MPCGHWAQGRSDSPLGGVQGVRQAATLGSDGDPPGAGSRELRARDLPAVRVEPHGGRGQAARTACEGDHDPAHGSRRGAQRVEDRGGHEVLPRPVGCGREIDEEVVGLSRGERSACDRGGARARTAARERERSPAGAKRRRECPPPRSPRRAGAAARAAHGAATAGQGARGRPSRRAARAWPPATSRTSSRAGRQGSRPGGRRCRGR